MFEMGESLNIANQSVNRLVCDELNRVDDNHNNLLFNFNSAAVNLKKIKSNLCMYSYMEDLIEHFLN